MPASQENLAYAKWECKYHVVFTEMPSPSPEPVRAAEKGSGQCVPRTGAPEGVPHRGRASAARPCPHAGIHSAQAQGKRGRRLHQGKERNLDCPALRWPKPEFHWPVVLGERLLRQHGGA